MAHWIVCQKSSQKEVIRKNACIAPKSQSVFLPCISSCPGHWQTSKPSEQGRVLSDREIDVQTTLLSWSQLESSAGKPFTSSSTNQTQRQEFRTTPLQGAGINEVQLPRAKSTAFLQNEGLFKTSTASLFSRLHAREKWRRCGNNNYQKNKVGVRPSRYRSKSVNCNGLTKN